VDEAEFNRIKDHAADFAHSAFQYAEYEELTDYQLVMESDALIFLRGHNNQSHTDQYLWAANSVDPLAAALPAEGPYLLTFIPPSWVQALEAAGLTIRNIWHDYFRPSLEDIHEEPDTACHFLSQEHIREAAEITQQCRGQSRGFTGQTAAWFARWLSEADSILAPAVLGYRIPDGVLAGVVCTGLYGKGQEGGPIVWIREVAVSPTHQGQGIGRHLVSQALLYGKQQGAHKAFLAVDEENLGAIHLYESLGFIASEEPGEINMILPSQSS